MSSPMFDLPVHASIGLNSDGNGPESDPDLIESSVCWEDGLPWPCPDAEPEMPALGRSTIPTGIDSVRQ